MRYLPTPMNIAAVLLITLAIYSFATSPKSGDGLQNFWSAVIFAVALIFFLVDYFIQLRLDTYKQIAITQGLLLGGFFFISYFNLKQEKLPEFTFPENFEKDYITVFYNIKNTPKLFGKKGIQLVPEDGIILASTDWQEPRWAATINGQKKNGEPITGSTAVSGELICGTKTYHYSILYIADYEYENWDAIKTEIDQDLQKQCDLLAQQKISK